MNVLHMIGASLLAAAGMFWTIFWALVLGFTMSGIVMTFVPKKKIAMAWGRSGPKELGGAMFFGAISSSCSYASAAMARSLFQKGAHIIPTLAFMLASTNLVIELSVVLWIMLGWQFVLAEFLGGIILVMIMAILMRLFGPIQAFEAKRQKLSGATRGHRAAPSENLDSDVADPKTLVGWQLAAQAFVSEWKMIGKDILLGVVISGALMVIVPESFWQSLFLLSRSQSANHLNLLQVVENALVGPIVSVVSFVCSVGNIPLASVLYHGGITFGGAISFIYADLIIIPLVLVYRRYYGWRLALWITGIFYVAMVTTGIIIDLLFYSLGWLPDRHAMNTMQPMHFFAFNYTFWLNLVFFIIAAVLVGLARSSSNSKIDTHCCEHGESTE